jgi:hypothetical protein
MLHLLQVLGELVNTGFKDFLYFLITRHALSVFPIYVFLELYDVILQVIDFQSNALCVFALRERHMLPPEASLRGCFTC